MVKPHNLPNVLNPLARSTACLCLLVCCYMLRQPHCSVLLSSHITSPSPVIQDAVMRASRVFFIERTCTFIISRTGVIMDYTSLGIIQSWVPSSYFHLVTGRELPLTLLTPLASLSDHVSRGHSTQKMICVYKGSVNQGT